MMRLLAACTQLNEITLNWPTAWVVIAAFTAISLVAWRKR